MASSIRSGRIGRAVHSKQGSPVELPVGRRTVKYYQVSEGELSMIGLASWLSSMFFGLATFFAALVAGMHWDVSMLDSATPQQAQRAGMMIWTCWACVGAFGLAAVSMSVWRLSRIRAIKRDHSFELATDDAKR